jgi:RNA polymerase sigma-70 factor (ECF subfamily)
MYGRRKLGDAAQAEDFAQHVLLTVIESIRGGKLREPDNIAGYIFGTCRLCVLEWIRGQRRDRSIAEQMHHVSGAAVDPAAVVDRERLAHCLDELPMRDRTIVLMTFYADRDCEEIADELALSIGNVRVIRHRALTRLKECLDLKSCQKRPGS